MQRPVGREVGERPASGDEGDHAGAGEDHRSRRVHGMGTLAVRASRRVRRDHRDHAEQDHDERCQVQVEAVGRVAHRRSLTPGDLD